VASSAAAAEWPQGVPQAAQEVVGGLAQDGLAVGLARVAEDDAEDVGASPPAVGQEERGTAAEIDLGLFAGTAFEAPEGQLQGRLQVADKPAHAVVAAGEAVLAHQVLMNTLGGQAEVELGLDGGAPRLAVTGASWGRRSLACRRRRDRRIGAARPDGRNGRFWIALRIRGGGGRK